MPKIFDAPANVTPDGATGRRASVEDVGVSGASIAAVGSGLSDVGEMLKRKAELDARAKADDAYNNERTRMLEDFAKAQSNAPEGAKGFTNGVKDTFDTRTKDLLDSDYHTPQSKAYMRTKLGGLKVTLLGEAIKFESLSSAKMRRNIVERGLESGKNIAMENEQFYGESLVSGLEQIAGAQVNGDTKALMEKDYRSDLAHKTLLGMVRRDPEAAIEMLGTEYWQGQLDASAFAQLQGAAISKKAQLDGAAVTVQNKAKTAARSALAPALPRPVRQQDADI